MKINSQSQNEIYNTFKKVCEQYENLVEEIITDYYVSVNMESGVLSVIDDDDKLLSETTINEWIRREDDEAELRTQIVRDIRKEIEKLDKAGEIEKMKVMKPFSFVMVDDDKEVIEDLYLVDDENVVIGSELMAGLDDELDSFIDKLLDEDE